MTSGNTEIVRKTATANYVLPTRIAGHSTFSIRVAEVKKDLERRGFPPNHTPQICNALRSKRFLQANNLELIATDGPPSKTSTTVVFHYRIKPAVDAAYSAGAAGAPVGDGNESQDDPFYRMYGFLKEGMARLGGGEKFIADLRSGDRNP